MSCHQVQIGLQLTQGFIQFLTVFLQPSGFYLGSFDLFPQVIDFTVSNAQHFLFLTTLFGTSSLQLFDLIELLLQLLDLSPQSFLIFKLHLRTYILAV